MRRWLPCFSMMLVSLISYVDRNTLAQLSPTILRQTHLSDGQYFWIISAFSAAYVVGNPLWGRVLDRVGLWVGMLVAVTLWSLASASHALAGGMVGFVAARALLGFGEGATFPGGLRTATQTLPPEQRARGIAVAYSGGSLGAILTPLLVTPIALRFGWRAAFIATGLLGAVWVLSWLQLGGWAELRRPRSPISGERPRFSDLRLWGFMAVYAFGAFPLAFVLYAAPIYLNRALGQSQAALAYLMVLPPLGWEVGYFFWGWLTDRLARTANPASIYRRLFAVLVLSSAPLALTAAPTRVAPVMVQLVFAMFVAAGFIIAGIAYATRIFSTRDAGFIAGLGAGSWSAVVAVVMPLLGRLFDGHAYARAFLVAALTPAVGFALWWALDGARPRASIAPQ